MHMFVQAAARSSQWCQGTLTPTECTRQHAWWITSAKWDQLPGWCSLHVRRGTVLDGMLCTHKLLHERLIAQFGAFTPWCCYGARGICSDLFFSEKLCYNLRQCQGKPGCVCVRQSCMSCVSIFISSRQRQATPCLASFLLASPMYPPCLV
jgi:hypothetical protein